MDTGMMIAIAVGVVALLAALAVWAYRRNTSDGRELKSTFGSEYDRTLDRSRDEDAAREDLRDRLDRRERFEVRELDDTERERYADRWTSIQREFVDDPERAVRDADQVIQDVMRTRGYPVEDFEQRAKDLSVDHPEVVERYRQGRRLLDRSERVPTEDHREAMVHYRALFEELVGTPVGSHRDDR
ncbi:MAG: hypothetical protein KY457_02670 [Actinobacteria bacterium]|nr:hypothetical protein [Actinomycetota bacterium]